MKGLDTNVLVRVFTRDNAEQAARAAAFIDQTYQSGSCCYINEIVLCELVWALARGYRLGRAEIADALETLLFAPHFVIEDERRVRSAVEAYREGRVDFADHLIGATNRAAGCKATATFDRNAARLDGFVAL